MKIEPINTNIRVPNIMKELVQLSMMGKMSPTAFQDTEAALRKFGCSAQGASNAFQTLSLALTKAELDEALSKHPPTAKPPTNRPWYRQTRW